MSRILLDTHTLIWMVSDESQLGDWARDMLFESELTKLVSPATYWEMAIKVKTGKLSLTSDYDEFFRRAIEVYDLNVLHVQIHHTSILTSLELYHRDPFDRLLIAQATVEDIPIVSIDTAFDPYPVSRIWSYAMRNEVEGNESDVDLDGEDGNE